MEIFVANKLPDIDQQQIKRGMCPWCLRRPPHGRDTWRANAGCGTTEITPIHERARLHSGMLTQTANGLPSETKIYRLVPNHSMKIMNSKFLEIL